LTKISKNNFAKNLVKIRSHYGLSQEAFAREIGISRGMVAGYETLCREPRLDVIVAISDYTDISIDELLKGNVEFKEE